MRYVITHHKQRREAVAKLQGGWFCWYCEKDGKSEKSSLVADHLVPRRHGGTEDIRNLVLACTACNTRKADKLHDKLIALGYTSIADRVETALAMRADWQRRDIRRALATPLEGADPGYYRYEKVLTDTPTAKVINAAMTFARMSTEQLRKAAGLGGWTLDRLRREEQNGTVTMWKRLSDATGYPIDEFLKVHTLWLSPEGTPQRELEYRMATLGINSTNLAKAMDIPNSQITRVMKGTAFLHISLVPLIAKALGCKPAFITRVIENMKTYYGPIPRPRPIPIPIPIPRPRPRPRDFAIPLTFWTSALKRTMAQFQNCPQAFGKAIGIDKRTMESYIDGRHFAKPKHFHKLLTLITPTPVQFVAQFERAIYEGLDWDVPQVYESVPSLFWLVYLRGFTGNALATQLNLSKNTVCVWIREDIQPKASNLAKASVALGVDAETLNLSLKKAQFLWCLWREKTYGNEEERDGDGNENEYLSEQHAGGEST